MCFAMVLFWMVRDEPVPFATPAPNVTVFFVVLPALFPVMMLSVMVTFELAVIMPPPATAVVEFRLFTVLLEMVLFSTVVVPPESAMPPP